MLAYKDREEQFEAARTIWNLAFGPTVREKIEKEQGLVELLEHSSKEGIDKYIKLVALGALWSIKQSGT